MLSHLTTRKFRNRPIRFITVSTLLSVILMMLVLPNAVGAQMAFGVDEQVVDSAEIDPQQAVEHAWELAYQSGEYSFLTDMIQTTEPANTLENAGRDTLSERLYVDGTANRAERGLQTRMWRAGFEEQALTIKVENGITYGRVGLNEWEEVSGYADAFAPGGDPMAFFAGATDVEFASTETRNFGDLSLTLKRYTFEFDGAAFAEHVRSDLEQTMKEAGELPASVHLETPDQFARSTGNGEVWIDADGLPRYLVLNLDFPRQASGDEVSAEIRTEFKQFDLNGIITAKTTLFESPSMWVNHRLPAIQAGAADVSFSLAMLLTVAFVILLAIHFRRTKVFHAALATFLIFNMVFSPLLNTRQASAAHETFQTEQADKQAKWDADQAEAEQEQEALDAMRSTDFDPHADQYATPAKPEVELASQPNVSAEAAIESNLSNNTNRVSLQSTTPITSTDSDNDGLSDADEAFYQTCASPNAPNHCTGVTDSKDSDADGISDGDEVHKLGTNPSYGDTDGDAILDKVEVDGYTDSNGTKWSLDPFEEDSNKDGLPDGVECPAWATNAASPAPGSACPDTDSDQYPGYFRQ